jgi:hypothetical protein
MPLVRSTLGASSLLRPTSTSSAARDTSSDSSATMAHIEQVRLLILGMEQRLAAREDKLGKTVEKAESEAKKFDEVHKHVLAKV